MDPTMEMTSIKNLFANIPVETARCNRDALLNELHALYSSQPELNKMENRRRYHAWVLARHPEVCKKAGFSKSAYDAFKPAFKKARLPADQKFLGTIPKGEYRWYSRFRGLKTSQIAEMVSTARDILHRYERAAWEDKPKYVVGRYIMGATKK